MSIVFALDDMAMEGTDGGRKRKATQALLDRNAEIIAVLNGERIKASLPLHAGQRHPVLVLPRSLIALRHVVPTTEFVKARGGGDPSSAEIALAKEAYDNMLSLSLSTSPKVSSPVPMYHQRMLLLAPAALTCTAALKL